MKALALTALVLSPLAAQAPAAPVGDRPPRCQALGPDTRARLLVLRAARREARRALIQALRAPDTPEARIRECHRRAAEAHLEVLLARRAHRAAQRAPGEAGRGRSR